MVTIKHDHRHKLISAGDGSVWEMQLIRISCDIIEADQVVIASHSDRAIKGDSEERRPLIIRVPKLRARYVAQLLS